MNNDNHQTVETNEILYRYEELEKQAEHAARYAQSVIETIHEPLLVLTEDFKVYSASRSFFDFFQVTPRETVGKVIYELGNRHFDIPELRKLLERILPDHEHFEGFELEFEFPNIGKKTLLLNARQVRGYPTLILLAIQDDTERRKAQDRQQEELSKSQEEYKILDRLIHIIAHDIRAPLINIEGFSQELEQSSDELHQIDTEEITEQTKKAVTRITSEHIPESVRYIRASIRKIDQLLHSLNNFLNAGTSVLNIEAVDMNELMQDVLATFKKAIIAADIKIEIDELPKCLADKLQINQVLSNLVDNAIKYLSPDRKGYVHIYGKTHDGKATYTVEDNGIGIAAEKQTDVFTMFFRIAEMDVYGQGIGLAACKQMVLRQNGSIRVESEIGKGSRFFVELPAAST